MPAEIDPEHAAIDRQLYFELAPATEQLYERHMRNTRVWYPHEYTPFHFIEGYDPAEPWDPNFYPLSPGVRSALLVNENTEDNLPYYTHTIRTFADQNREHPFFAWINRWTAEEARHSMVIRDWIIATRALDPRVLEDSRMAQMSGGVVPEPATFAETIAYVSFQELATQVAHRDTGVALGMETGGQQVMAIVAGDETLHYNFYSDLVAAGLDIAPAFMLRAIHNQLTGFEMPGTGIPDFKVHSIEIAAAGIYSAAKFREKVVIPTLQKKWDLDNLPGLSPEAAQIRDDIFDYVDNKLARIVRIQNGMIERHLAKNKS